MNDQGATTHDGHGLDTNEQRTGRRTDADACSLRRTKRGKQVGGAAGRARAFLETARASSKPAQGSYGAERGGRTEREASEIGSAARRPLYARDPFFFLVLLLL